MAKLNIRWVIPGGRPKAGQHLSEAQQRRYMNAGITRGQYESGAKVTGARGHGKTPEHGIGDARKHPEKYRDYIQKKEPPRRGGDVIEAGLAQLIEQAQRNSQAQLGNYIKYNRERTFKRIAGKITFNKDGSIKSRKGGMTKRQLRITAIATSDELRTLASEQREGNPFYYH